jgi:hypothetical protein
LTFTASFLDENVEGKIKFLLSDPTSLPVISAHVGWCSNAGDDTDDDLQILEDDNPDFDIEILDSGHVVATTIVNRNSATIVVSCFDYGAHSKVSAKGVLMEGTTEVEYPAVVLYDKENPENPVTLNDTRPYACIPYDEDGDNMADSWEAQFVGHGGIDKIGKMTESHDDDYAYGNTSTNRHISTGDGFTAFDEYRGFVTQDGYKRTDPTQKDVYIRVEDSLLGYHPNKVAIEQLGYKVYFLARDQYYLNINNDYHPENRRMAFNGVSTQKCLRLRLYNQPGYFGQNFCNYYEGYGEPLSPYAGVPSENGNGNIFINPTTARDNLIKRKYDPAIHLTNAVNNVCTHECGHSFGLWHEGHNNLLHYHTHVSDKCVMYTEWNNLTPGIDPESFCIDKGNYNCKGTKIK